MPFEVDFGDAIIEAPRLYKREVSLTLSRPAGRGAAGYFAQASNAVVVRDLRVSFTVEKQLGSDPNKATITVYNFAEPARAELQRPNLHVRLDAGYDGDLKRLFVGDTIWCQSTLERTDWITRMTLGDGERAYRHARVNRSFRGGVRVTDLIKESASSLGLPTPLLDGITDFATAMLGGETLSGRASTELTRVLKPHNASWSVQDGRLQILRGDAARPGTALLVSQDTGMIGVPEYGAPQAAATTAAGKTKKGKAPVLTVRTLLYPTVTPGGLIKVESRAVRGIFRVERVVHTGDTFGADWTTTIEAKPR